MTSALIVLDMQTDLLDAQGRFPVSEEQVPRLIERTNEAIAAATAGGVPVVYVQNAFSPLDPGNLFRGGCCVRGRPGGEIDARVDVADGAMRFDKARGDAFSNAELGSWVRERGVTSVAVAGVYADGCVTATVKGARREGLDVTVLSDAVAARGTRALENGLRKSEAAGAAVETVAGWTRRVPFGHSGAQDGGGEQ